VQPEPAGVDRAEARREADDGGHEERARQHGDLEEPQREDQERERRRPRGKPAGRHVGAHVERAGVDDRVGGDATGDGLGDRPEALVPAVEPGDPRCGDHEDRERRESSGAQTR
jgi:hypothetical protein